MLERKWLNTLGVILICTFLIFSCKTNKSSGKTSTTEKNTLNVQLEDSLTGKYISNTYSKYKPAGMSPSNRTLNQYVVNFDCSSSEFTTLMELLEADSNVEIIKSSNQSNIQSSKSVKSAKTKSIRNNN